ncbi:hypothetical protein BTM25_42750 [Actinomadura rubteroloni]|uniref:DUF5302 domain-containing protein n=1 Tax=Actinomadura rubteroloni TaxID=1926885 RepID=A0A2P4UDJ1_9ACTN|nr:DUF5302 domain-containing protein [Actinomadura rubteroloni]POM23123.1 hypothetical protein BTM25_42750 [Actinomadura rubteroloni]
MADSTDDNGGPEELKKRFREALERKRGAAADRQGAGGGKGGKVRGAHERADHQRQFRRKSG